MIFVLRYLSTISFSGRVTKCSTYESQEIKFLRDSQNKFVFEVLCFNTSSVLWSVVTSRVIGIQTHGSTWKDMWLFTRDRVSNSGSFPHLHRKRPWSCTSQTRRSLYYVVGGRDIHGKEEWTQSTLLWCLVERENDSLFHPQFLWRPKVILKE